MAAALLILVAMVAVGAGLNPSREQFAWFLRLRRPAWLGFERVIPLIWLAIYVCFYASALVDWRSSWSWGLMGAYLGLLLLGHSRVSGLLLVPYLLWSPVGTLVTWQMQRLNR